MQKMRPKAREVAQHGGPPGWLEESDPAGVILYMMDGLYLLPFRTIPVALRGLLSCELMEFPSAVI